MQATSPLFSALRKALLLGACLLVAPAFAAPQGSASSDRSASVAAGLAKKAAKPAGTKKSVTKAPARKISGNPTAGPMADFGKADPAPDVEHVANWVSHTRNNKQKSFVIIDKKMARLYVFNPQGKLKSHTPVLLGKAIGDHSAPGIGNKPISQIKEEEKTTPAGRFLAAPGKNLSGEDIIWIDYNAAVSMHRLRKVAAAERRPERMATPEASDNRISNGCVNVPPAFYNSVLKPTVMKHGAIVYVLPETKSPQQQFGSVDVAPKGDKRS